MYVERRKIHTFAVLDKVRGVEGQVRSFGEIQPEVIRVGCRVNRARGWRIEIQVSCRVDGAARARYGLSVQGIVPGSRPVTADADVVNSAWETPPDMKGGLPARKAAVAIGYQQVAVAIK